MKETMTTLTETDPRLRDARDVHNSLISERAAFDQRAADLAAERERISFSAFRGDLPAKRRLSQIHNEVAKQTSEVASIDAAILEAIRRVADAEADQHAAQEADRAREALSLLSDFREHGARLDDAVKALIGSYEHFKSCARSLRALGASPVSEQLQRVAMRRALIAGLISTDMQVEHLAPNERHSFSELCAAWASSIEGWAARRLPETTQPETQEEA
jgi:hypothetical protein